MHLVDAEPDAGTGRRYASALSEHPDPAQAAAEVTAEVLERLGPVPELAVLFVTPPHRDAVDDIADVVRAVLRPVTLLGAAAVAVLGAQTRSRTDARCLAVRRPAWFTRGPRPPRRRTSRGRVADRRSSRPRSPASGRCCWSLTRSRSQSTPCWNSWPRPTGPGGRGRHGVGGKPTGRQPAACRRRRRYTDGAIGALLTDDVSPQAVVSQGCRPIGHPYIVTRADGHMLHELGGRPALERSDLHVERLPPATATSPSRVCTAVSSSTKPKTSSNAATSSSVACSAPIVPPAQWRWATALPVGSTVQFQVRDAASADEDLHAVLVRTCRRRCARVHLQRARPPAVRHTRPRRHRGR